MPDIDIDFPNREKALEKLKYIPAAIVNGKRTKHQTGVYFQNIPINPIDGMALYDYKEAEKQGFFKIDFLPNSLYEGIQNEEHLITLLEKEPMWELFLEEDIVKELAQIHSHIDVLRIIKPRSIEDLAICIALIRPGKRHLINKPMDQIKKEIWNKSDEGYHYKKSHAIAFAASIVVQLNHIIEKLYEE